MPYSRHTCPSLELRVLRHYTGCRLQWDCSEATAILQGPQASGRGQATFWSTAGMNGLAASRASCRKLYQHAAPTDGSPLEKPPAAAAWPSRRPSAHPALADMEADTEDAQGAKTPFKNARAPLGTLLRLSHTKQAALGVWAGSLQ